MSMLAASVLRRFGFTRRKPRRPFRPGPARASAGAASPALRGSPATRLVGGTILCLLLAVCRVAPAFADAPAVTGVSPDHGAAAGGAEVSVTGSGFTPGATVEFGGVAAPTVLVTGAGTLTATAPPGSGTVDVTVTDSGGDSPATAADLFAYEPAPDGPWLGLNGNSLSNAFTGEWLGPADEFSRYGIAYDRSFELTAGETPAETESDSKGSTYFEDRLATDHRYGMIPVAQIEYEGYTGDLSPDPAFPQEDRTPEEEARGETTISEYVRGFVRSASSLLGLVARTYPGMPVLLEPMNEPWGYTTPRYNGGEYARVIAALLPAARAAGIPASDIYVSAFGADQEPGEEGEPELSPAGWVPAMYAAEPSLASEVQGWYFHPYGPPAGTEFDDSWGIESVPAVRQQIQSGRDNILVSEDGYCARSEGGECDGTGGSEVETRPEAAQRLTAALEVARAYHEAGWLRAMIVYARNDGGWSMVEYPSLQLSPQGEALIAFAQAHGFGEGAGREAPSEGATGGSEETTEEQRSAAGGAGVSDQQLGSLGAALGAAGSSLAASTPPSAVPPPGSPPPLSRVGLPGTPAQLRHRALWIALSCAGAQPCGGRLTIAIPVRERRHATREVTIASAPFVLRPRELARVRVPVSDEGRRLLAGASSAGAELVVRVAQSSPSVRPLVTRRLRLLAAGHGASAAGTAASAR